MAGAGSPDASCRWIGSGPAGGGQDSKAGRDGQGGVTWPRPSPPPGCSQPPLGVLAGGDEEPGAVHLSNWLQYSTARPRRVLHQALIRREYLYNKDLMGLTSILMPI